jgi:hypothetical protein
MSSVGVPGSRYSAARHRIISHRLAILGERAASGIRADTLWAGQDVAAAGDGGRPRAPEAVKAAGRESGRPNDGHGAGPCQPTGAGLVICAKSVRDAVEGGVNTELFGCGRPGAAVPALQPGGLGDGAF